MTWCMPNKALGKVSPPDGVNFTEISIGLG